MIDHNDRRNHLGGNGSGGERIERGGTGSGRVAAFRGLSKSALRLLSQDRQTLSELLDVGGGAAIINNDDGPGGIGMNNIGGVGGGGIGVEDIIDEGNHQQTDGPVMDMIREEQVPQYYMNMQQLEDKYLQEQNEKIRSLQREWEGKLVEQEKQV